MNRPAVFLLVLSLIIAEAASAANESNPERGASSGIFFVATNGNDSWSGGKSLPERNRADGPFATLPRALQAARDWKQNRTTGTPGSATIYIRSGVYFLDKPLSILPEDSGLTVAAFRGEQPVLSGGRRITHWKTSVDGRTLWVADAPEAREGKWMFRELWVNGQRAVRARHPNKGYFAIAELPDKGAQWTQGQARFRFREGDVKAWKSITNAEIVAMTKWVESRLPVIALDEPARLVSFGKRSVFELAPGDPYYLEGALEVLDEPGEWCLDPAAGRVFYMPRPGEKLNQIEAIAPVLTQVVRLEGRPDQKQFIERVTMRGLKFAHTEWYFPENDRNKPLPAPEKMEVGGFSQAAIGVPGAVWGEGVHESQFEDCTFSNLGNYGLELGRGCQSNRIVHCEFSDLGAGGVKLGETTIREQSSDQSRANEISDCHIHDGGKMFQSAIGVWIGQSPDNRILHNHIHDFYYTGISIGWTWGYGSALASNNLVAFNHVHHIGVKSDGDGPVLSDMAGIYTLGKQPCTRIVNNLWHDIAAVRYGGWGIYFDEGSSGILAQSNLVYRTTHGGFHQHYGETNMVWNNIFAFARDQQLQRSRVEPHLSFSFATNIVYFDAGNLLGSEWSDNHFRMDGNVYFDARPEAKPDSLRFGKATLDEWRARGHDQHSIIADPLFVAPQRNDFHLQPNSTALKMGFCPIDLRFVGVRGGPVSSAKH